MSDTWQLVVLKPVAAGSSSRKPGFDPTPFHVSFVRVFLFLLTVSCHQSYTISSKQQDKRTFEKAMQFIKPWINGRTELPLTLWFPHQSIFSTLPKLTSKSKAHGYFHHFSSPSSAAETLINSEVSQCAVCGVYSGTGSGHAPSTSAASHQWSAPYSYIHPSTTDTKQS